MARKPTEVEIEDELYKQVGRAIVGLSDVEHLLETYCILVNGKVGFEAVEIFHDQGSFERRLKFVDFSIRRVNRAELSKAWAPIFTKLNTHRGIRNLIAHQGMIWDRRDETVTPTVYLQPSIFKKRPKGAH